MHSLRLILWQKKMNMTNFQDQCQKSIIEIWQKPRSCSTNQFVMVRRENPKLYQEAVAKFEKIGCELVSLDIEPLLELARCLYEGPWVAERYVAVKDFFATNPPEKDLDPTVTKIIKGGEHYSAATCFQYEYKRQGIVKSQQIVRRH